MRKKVWLHDTKACKSIFIYKRLYLKCVYSIKCKVYNKQ